jgi:hypothetical protein
MTKIWEGEFEGITVSLHRLARGLYEVSLKEPCKDDPKSIMVSAEKLMFLQQEIERALKKDWEEVIRAEFDRILKGEKHGV